MSVTKSIGLRYSLKSQEKEKPVNFLIKQDTRWGQEDGNVPLVTPCHEALVGSIGVVPVGSRLEDWRPEKQQAFGGREELDSHTNLSMTHRGK